MKDLHDAFKDTRTRLDVIKVSQHLIAEGYSITDVNAAATKRRKQILSESEEVNTKLQKVLVPVVEENRRVSHVNASFERMQSSKLCISKNSGLFLWK